ncbi:hypothetical protein AALP_AA7G090500 [Arabis alpina]|uniref:Uncharacterized protein n=1 Tax=Arabis alpina TaxID=50452 RepID=A0A087GGV9_ARAAL|nr:hypothetical protein AALP_AA7G090500 [Arabis alpina]
MIFLRSPSSLFRCKRKKAKKLSFPTKMDEIVATAQIPGLYYGFYTDEEVRRSRTKHSKTSKKK